MLILTAPWVAATQCMNSLFLDDAKLEQGARGRWAQRHNVRFSWIFFSAPVVGWSLLCRSFAPSLTPSCCCLLGGLSISFRCLLWQPRERVECRRTSLFVRRLGVGVGCAAERREATGSDCCTAVFYCCFLAAMISCVCVWVWVGCRGVATAGLEVSGSE